MSNIKITTQNGFIAELRPFITMEDEEHIKDAFTENTSLSGIAGQSDLHFSIEASRSKLAQQRTLEAVLVSIEGEGLEGETPYEKFKKLPTKDGHEILERVEEITGDKKKENTASAT